MLNADPSDLTGKVAVVTGAGGLLGPQHATALALAGCTVVLTDVRPAAALTAAAVVTNEAPFARADHLPLDVTSPTSVGAALQLVLERHGRVDILVNNAALDPKVGDSGGGPGLSRFERYSLAHWNAEIAVGLTGAFLCCQAFGSWMADHEGGAILNIASDLSVFAPDQRIYRREGLADDEQPVKPVTYSVIKTGLVGMTKYLATYWADKSVRVNALSPGGVYTGQPDEFVRKLTNLIPIGRMATPDEYRGAVVFLCSDASRYMTGQNIVLDGGRSVW